MLGGYRTAFNQRQQIALHPFTRNIGTRDFSTLTDFVDFIDKHDAVIFDIVNRLLFQLFLID
ncbi:Uncharacterised protein [Vibrio cholerae]|uniref:Uncharacterized protein n=1 Tax=Vibrio cholerae TaxID=666 RepID=A0A655RIV8_VIBCL|nr:Uncharacterised protein [Vibrio cholerae]CSB93608.1 Uncharacterised protein [Vibrio cholerae]